MPHQFRGERTLMRIFIGESDRAGAGPRAGQPLYDAVLHLLRDRGLAGATVTRGIAGFGASARIHTDRILRLSLDLPIVIEIVETEDRLQEILPDLDRLIEGGLITLEKVRVILYRPAGIADSERWRHRIEGLSPEE